MKTYTQQELEEAIKKGCEEIKKIMGKESKEQLKNEIKEHRRQAQLELLDEIIIDGFPLPISLDRESWYDIGVSTGARIVTNYYENYIREKREQLTNIEN